MRMFWSISYMTTRNDNGHCLTFRTRAEAERCRTELIEAGCFHVSAIWN